jgi:SAM-dependent methyltransferase
MKSPLTNSFNVSLEEEITCQSIIDAYDNDYNIDVREYFKGVDFVKIYKCLDTGYRFYFPFSIVGKSQLYEELQKRSGYYKLRLEHQVAEAFFKANDSVLEIGCGNGFFLKKLQQQGLSCTGLEFNEDAIKDGQDQSIRILKQDIIEHAKTHYGHYDVVCSFQVLEHITEIHDFIRASIESLKTGGKYIIGVPNNNPFLYRYDKYHTLNLPPHHMGLWDKQSLKNLQKYFNIRLDNLLIEPLQIYDYEYYFKIQIQHLKCQSIFIGNIAEMMLLSMRSTKIRLKLQRIISRFVQGRNLLAVYTKL